MGRFGRVGVVAAAVVIAATASSCAAPLIGVPGGSVAAPSPGQPPSGQPSPGQPSAQLPDDGVVRECAQPAAGEQFEQVDPGSVDLDTQSVIDAMDYGSARGAQSLRVYRHGCLVARSANDPMTDWVPLPAWSMTKGVVALVTGRAVTMGHLGLDDPIGTHLAGLDAEHGAITVRHLLTQTSGLRFAWANDLNAAGTGDSAALVLQRPFEAAPGTQFVYAQTTVTALIAVVEAAVGEDFQSFAARELFRPIGIPDGEWAWQRDMVGRTQGFAFLDMSPRSFGRIGSLMLEQGRWRGQELIAPSYFAEGRAGTAANPGYGFLWMTNRGEHYLDTGPGLQRFEHRWMRPLPADAFALTGMLNQQVVVVPSLDIVVVRMGLPADLFTDPFGDVDLRRPGWDHRFYRMLMAGVTDVDVPDAGDWTKDPDPPVIDPKYLIDLTF